MNLFETGAIALIAASIAGGAVGQLDDLMVLAQVQNLSGDVRSVAEEVTFALSTGGDGRYTEDLVSRAAAAAPLSPGTTVEVELLEGGSGYKVAAFHEAVQDYAVEYWSYGERPGIHVTDLVEGYGPLPAPVEFVLAQSE